LHQDVELRFFFRLGALVHSQTISTRQRNTSPFHSNAQRHNTPLLLQHNFATVFDVTEQEASHNNNRPAIVNGGLQHPRKKDAVDQLEGRLECSALMGCKVRHESETMT